MPKPRSHSSVDFKANVAGAAIQGQHTVNEIAANVGVHSHHVVQWQKPALEALPEAFAARRVRAAQDEEAGKAQRYQPIGQRNVEVDWRKKKLDARLEVKRQFVEPAHQCITASDGRASCWGGAGLACPTNQSGKAPRI